MLQTELTYEAFPPIQKLPKINQNELYFNEFFYSPQGGVE